MHRALPAPPLPPLGMKAYICNISPHLLFLDPRPHYATPTFITPFMVASATWRQGGGGASPRGVGTGGVEVVAMGGVARGCGSVGGVLLESGGQSSGVVLSLTWLE